MEKKTMSSEKRILGIPLVTFGIIVFVFCGIAYYASGYASQNQLLRRKNMASNAKILSLSRLSEKLEQNKKIIEAKLKTEEESNRDLQMQVTNADKKSAESSKEKKKCQSQMDSLHDFFLHAKDQLHASSNEDPHEADNGEISDNEITSLKASLSKFKSEHDTFKQEMESCAKTKETLSDTYQSMQKHENKFQALLKENNELKTELHNVRKLNDEAEEKILHFERESNKPGFQQKKKETHQENVRMIDLNQQISNYQNQGQQPNIPNQQQQQNLNQQQGKQQSNTNIQTNTNLHPNTNLNPNKNVQPNQQLGLPQGGKQGTNNVIAVNPSLQPNAPTQAPVKDVVTNTPKTVAGATKSKTNPTTINSQKKQLENKDLSSNASLAGNKNVANGRNKSDEQTRKNDGDKKGENLGNQLESNTLNNSNNKVTDQPKVSVSTKKVGISKDHVKDVAKEELESNDEEDKETPTRNDLEDEEEDFDDHHDSDNQ